MLRWTHKASTSKLRPMSFVALPPRTVRGRLFQAWREPTEAVDRWWSIAPLLDLMYECPQCQDLSESPGEMYGTVGKHVSTNRVWGGVRSPTGHGQPCKSPTHVAARMGVELKEILRDIHRGYVTDEKAERYAAKLHLLPHEVWGPEWFTAALERPGVDA